MISSLQLKCCGNYRGFLPNATFGSGKNSHWPKFALAKLVQKIALMKYISQNFALAIKSH